MSVDVKELLNKVEDETVRQQLGEQFDSLSGSQLRKERDEAVTEAKELKAEKRQRTYRDAKVPESAFDILDKVYDGELTPEAVRDFAKEKGFSLSDAEEATGDESTGTTPDPAAQRQQGEDRLSQLNQGAIPARDPSTLDELKKAEAEGRTNDAIRLNLQLQREQNAA